LVEGRATPDERGKARVAAHRLRSDAVPSSDDSESDQCHGGYGHAPRAHSHRAEAIALVQDGDYETAGAPQDPGCTDLQEADLAASAAFGTNCHRLNLWAGAQRCAGGCAHDQRQMSACAGAVGGHGRGAHEPLLPPRKRSTAPPPCSGRRVEEIAEEAAAAMECDAERGRASHGAACLTQPTSRPWRPSLRRWHRGRYRQ
jgi:hypothetical protein